MKWTDYREKLGIGFSDKSKAKLLCNKIATFISAGAMNENYSSDDYYRFCLMVGAPYSDTAFPAEDRLSLLFTKKEISVPVAISYYIAFVNSQTAADNQHIEDLIDVLCEFLEDLSIPYEVLWDEDGAFVFPKGVPEMDEALVSAPLDWLVSYPEARKAWVKALKEYSNQTDENASDIADKFRKALETFFREFFSVEKSLENCKAEYGRYLKERGVPSDIAGNFETLLQAYTNYMNGYAKHQDRASKNVLEYLMYQTGNIIRLLITLKQEAENNAD